MKTAATKKDLVLEKIRQAILAGEIKPGEIFNENELARRFGTGKTPTREALIVLAHEQYIEPLPRIGYIVAKTTIQDVLETFQLRIILEVEAVGLAADRIGAAELDALERNNLSERQLAAERSRDDYDRRAYELNRDFHVAVACASGNSRLALTVQRLLEDMQRMLVLDPYPTDPAEHEGIIAALRHRDKTAAQEAMRRHLEQARYRILNRY
jgi:DNA-binding GntR family transcriptional regulator